MELIAFLFCKSVRLGGNRKTFDLSLPNFTTMNFPSMGETPPIPLFSIWSRDLSEPSAQYFHIEVERDGKTVSGSRDNLVQFSDGGRFSVRTAPNLTLKFSWLGEHFVYVRFGERRVPVSRVFVGQPKADQPQSKAGN